MNKDQIIEAIKNMTVLELNELVEACEAEFGVSAAAPVAVAAAGEAAGEEQSEFDVVLKEVGGEKIKVMVDGAPSTLKEGVEKAEADAIKAQLEEVGATVELK